MHQKSIRNRLRGIFDFSSVALPKQTLVEMLDTGRVIVENHEGICLYTHERICVRALYGILIICGCELKIARMTKDQLVITGEITNISTERVCCG